jgi:hypothetical protein
VPIPTRAARLAAWGTAYLRRHVPLDQALAAVEGDDEPHLVCRGMAAPDELGETLGELRDAGWAGLRLALPAPGDPLGLTGPAEVNREALRVGEGVLAVPGPGAATVPALVPDVTPFGPPGDQGFCVSWRHHEAAATSPAVPTVGEADRDLRAHLASATDELRRLDAVPWATTPGRLDALRGQRPTLPLPPATEPRALALADQALAVLVVVDAARRDDGGALSAHVAAQRAAALAPLDRAARRALVAACSPSLTAARR